MANNSKTGVSGHLEIKIPIDTTANEQLVSLVFSALENRYGTPLPAEIGRRADRELQAAVRFGYAPVYLAHRDLMRAAKQWDYPFCLMCAAGASLIDYALGISSLNPLLPHYTCSGCKRVEFLSDEDDRDFPLPDKPCPVCGKTMQCDGQNLCVESFLGYHLNRCPSFVLGVPAAKWEDAIGSMEDTFLARQKDRTDSSLPVEAGFLFIDIDIEPIDLPAKGQKTVSFAQMDDPAVFEYLSRPEAFACYMPHEPQIPFVKELLDLVTIEHRSDLFKICGLVHSSGWLPYILPLLKNGSVDYRTVITAREDIYRHLLRHGVAPETAYSVMEQARKGRAAKLLEENNMGRSLLASGISVDYLRDLGRIGYLITRAGAGELAMTVYRNARIHLYERG